MNEFISFRDKNKLIVRILSDGKVEIGEDVELDEASELFYTMLSNILVDRVPLMCKDYCKGLLIAGDRMAGRIELLEHHCLADDHDVVAREMWLIAKDKFK